VGRLAVSNLLHHCIHPRPKPDDEYAPPPPPKKAAELAARAAKEAEEAAAYRESAEREYQQLNKWVVLLGLCF